MDNTIKSTAGIRQFEQTAVAKLMAEGVPKHIADAFVHHGVPKSGRVQALKDQVCKMTYEKFLIERNAEDFKNPMRVGAMVPRVEESKMQKFFAEFKMSDLDAARFTKAFPEFDVVARGTVYNQHAFYANKRYAETELLVSMVYYDAKTTFLNPRSLVDFGGNDSWHAKRKRDYVHCDNPVLSSRDIMRYKSREIFSGSDRSAVCSKKFSDCTFKSDYAISVHSTYDVSPKELARAMAKKNTKKFFGVINYIPGIEIKPEGTYEADGMVMKVVRPARAPAYVECGFKHDPSLRYVHRLSVLRKYLYVAKRYDFVQPDGSTKPYTYKIHSVRGNSLVFSVSQGAANSIYSDAIWTPPTRKMYYISLRFLGLHRMEVDSEFFDRLVLQVAGARNFEQYDIVSLFRHAKSLRQRVSINGVVLSSGYTQSPDQLVYSTIAAYGTAVAYRAESGEFFKRAVSQVVNLRGRGFFRDIVSLSGTAVLSVLLLLPKALAYVTGMSALSDKIKAMVASGGSIDIELFKPHAGRGYSFVPKVFRRNATLSAVTGVLNATEGKIVVKQSLLDFMQPTFVECDEVPMTFYSKGLVTYDAKELPQATVQPKEYFFEGEEFLPSKPFEEVRSKVYEAAMDRVGLFPKFERQALVLGNGDRVYRKGITQADGFRAGMRDHITVLNREVQYVVFRGVGNHAVVLKPPNCYSKGVCLLFVLFYFKRSRFSNHQRKMESEGFFSGSVFELPDEAIPFEERLEDKLGDRESWSELSDGETLVRRFTSMEEGRRFVEEKLDQGEHYMSGALASSGPATPPPDEAGGFDGLSNYVSSFTKNTAFEDGDSDSVATGATAHRRSSDADHGGESSGESRVISGGEDGGDFATVLSEDIVPGKEAMGELVRLCAISEEVAIATSKAVVDLATSAARGDAPVTRWSAVAQGHPGNLRMVKVEGDDWVDMVSGESVQHMAVSDGERVYDRITRPPPDGVYVTSDVMAIYTGAAVKDAVCGVLLDVYSCPTVCVNGVAGCGKSYFIEHNAAGGDVVLCETRESLEDVARGLHRVPGWRGHAYTVDAFLMHKPVLTAEVVWIDEAFRLHAGKIYACMKILKPKKICCFGDNKQIQTLSFVPGFDFVYHQFPFLSTTLKKESYRCPADVCFVLSTPRYYGFHVLTHNPVLRSLQRPLQFVAGMFDSKPSSVPLLVYTQTCKEDLQKQGVKRVLTIGESQGKTYDEVIVFRESALPKEIYFSAFQTLVAVTRHKKRFTYVTADTLVNDGSGVARLLAYMLDKGTEFLYSAHVCSGVKPAADAAALEARVNSDDSAGRRRGVSMSSEADDSYGDIESWADFMEDEVSGSEV